MTENSLMFVGQKAFVEKEGKLLVLHDPEEGLDFPGGRIQKGEVVSGQYEGLAESLKREVREEVGIEVEVLEPIAVGYQEFPQSHELSGVGTYLVVFRCRYMSGDINLSSEHDNWRWIDQEDYIEVDDGTEYFKFIENYFTKR